jgi:hypothetical protein
MSNEKQVSLGEVAPERAVGLLGQESGRESTASDVESAIPKFEEKAYTYFTARHGVVAGDLVIQFFLPKVAVEAAKKGDATSQRKWESFWLETFRDQLSPVAKSYFHAEYPHLVAKYTEEVASWWFRARGYGDSVAPMALAEGFELRLNEALALALTTAQS